MKKLPIIIIIALIVPSLCFIQCKKDNNQVAVNPKLDTLSFSHSMKGWELYSWPSVNAWNYSVLQGTNRAKTEEEITTNKIAVIGTDSVKMILAKLPANEEIFWIHAGNFYLPDNNTIVDIKTFCDQKKLTLNIN